MKKPTKKKSGIVKWVVFALLVIATVVITIFQNKIFGKNVGTDQSGNIIWDPVSIFNKDVSSNVFVQYMYSKFIPNALRTIQIAGFAVVLAVALHYIAKISFKSKKGLTISKLVVNFVKWAIALTAAFFILDAWGADTKTMLVSAGVVTLIIGLGSQSLVADILAGIFIVFEGEFQVGDIVLIDGWRGEVLQIGIRTTRLIDAGGNIKIVNNSEIKTIINQTQELSIAKCYISLAYEYPIEKAEAIIAENIDKIKEKIPAIKEGPFYKGVSELAASSVDLLFVAKCLENDIYQVQRDLNREIKIMFDNNDIGIPFPQIVVHTAKDDDEVKVTKKEVKKAQDFNEEQKELSKSIDVKNSN